METKDMPLAENKFTPGPWMQGQFKWNQIVTSHDPIEQNTICLVHGSESEAVANARLIASAPELFKALIQLQKLATQMDRSDLKLTFEMMEVAHNAIKKAKGE